MFVYPKAGHIGQLWASKHTVVCRADQEAGAQLRVYIDRKKKINFRTSVALCCLDETRRILLCTFLPTSVPTFQM